ncbi:HEAT repeat domain-containing protein [Cellulomonas soli]
MTDRLGTTATWLLLASCAVVGLLLVAIIAVRVAADLRRRTQTARRTQALPVLMDVLDGHAVPVPRRRRDAAALAPAASDLVHKVRGADREVLAAWLTDGGFRDAALRAMRSPWAPRRAHAIELYLATTSGQEPGPVVAMLRDRHPRVRLAAVRALGDSGAHEAVPALVRAAGSRRRPVPASAVTMALVHAAPADASALRHVWTSGDPVLVTTALTICGHLGLVDARPQIEHLVRSPDPALRLRAVDALGRIGDPRSALPLRRALHTTPPGSIEWLALHRALAAVGVDQPRFAP